ncbi:MAG: hypothetical protein RCO49_07885 [Rickettsia endosymbiont of Argas persicus]
MIKRLKYIKIVILKIVTVTFINPVIAEERKDKVCQLIGELVDTMFQENPNIYITHKMLMNKLEQG